MTSTPIVGQLFKQPLDQPLTDDGKVLAATSLGNAYRMFYLTNSTTPVTVYKDAAYTLPYAAGPVFANASGQFLPIYLDPAYEYRSQLFDGNGRLLEDCDTVNNNGVSSPLIAGVALSAFKATTTTRTSPGALTPDPDLQITLANAGTFKIDADLIFTVASATSMEAIFTGMSVGQGGASSGGFGNFYPIPFFGTVGGVVAAGGQFTISDEANEFKTILNLTTGPLSNVIRITGTVQSLGTALFQFQWGDNSNPVNLLAGSSLTVLQVA